MMFHRSRRFGLALLACLAFHAAALPSAARAGTDDCDVDGPFEAQPAKHKVRVLVDPDAANDSLRLRTMIVNDSGWWSTPADAGTVLRILDGNGTPLLESTLASSSWQTLNEVWGFMYRYRAGDDPDPGAEWLQSMRVYYKSQAQDLGRVRVRAEYTHGDFAFLADTSTLSVEVLVGSPEDGFCIKTRVLSCRTVDGGLSCK